MPIEIEKKYRLTPGERRAIEKRLRELGYKPKKVGSKKTRSIAAAIWNSAGAPCEFAA